MDLTSIVWNCVRLFQGSGLSTNSLRAALREHTAESHARLDAAIGPFHDIESYRSFVLNSYLFRSLVEPECDAVAAWPVLPLVAAMQADMDDLKIASAPQPLAPIALPDWSTKLGALYVLEGSGVGARLLFRRAQTLGLGAEFGARHLAIQVEDMHRWPAFLAILEAADTEPAFDRSAALASAQVVFERALEIYRS